MKLSNSFWSNPPIILVLDDYEAANLHWLLRVALLSIEARKNIHTNTGDWNGQILWQLEEAIKEKFELTSRRMDGPKSFQKPNSEYPKESVSIEDMLKIGIGIFNK